MWIFLFFNWIFFWYVMSSKVLKSILFTWTYQTRDTITSKKNLFVEKCFLFFFLKFFEIFLKSFWNYFCQFRCKFLCKKKIEIFEKIKKKIEFSEVSSNFGVFLWKFRFSENFVVVVKHEENAVESWKCLKKIDGIRAFQKSDQIVSTSFISGVMTSVNRKKMCKNEKKHDFL